DAADEPVPQHVVHLGDPHGQLGGVVEREHVGPGAQLDPLGPLHGPGQHQVTAGNGLPGGRQVLAHPGLFEAQLLAPLDDQEVLFDAVGQRPLRRMGGLQEHAVLHRLTSFVSTTQAPATSPGTPVDRALASLPYDGPPRGVNQPVKGAKQPRGRQPASGPRRSRPGRAPVWSSPSWTTWPATRVARKPVARWVIRGWPAGRAWARTGIAGP